MASELDAVIARVRATADKLDTPDAVDTLFRVSNAKAFAADLRALLAAVEEAREDLADALAQQGDIVGRLTSELDAKDGLLADFYPEDATNLRDLPDIPWRIGGKSGAEIVSEWRNDLAMRIERVIAARAVPPTREGA